MATDSELTALLYFRECISLLGEAVPREFAEANECDSLAALIEYAPKEAQLRFVNAVLESITRNASMDVPEEIALQALWAVCDSSSTSLAYTFYARDVPSDLRRSVLKKIRLLFLTVFPRRCRNCLVGDIGDEVRRWNSLCFMWWDFIPRNCGENDWHCREIDLQVIDILGQSLAVDHLACQEAALWGLSQWSGYLYDEAIAMIDTHADDIPEALRECAEMAKDGLL